MEERRTEQPSPGTRSGPVAVGFLASPCLPAPDCTKPVNAWHTVRHSEPGGSLCVRRSVVRQQSTVGHSAWTTKSTRIDTLVHF